MQPGEGRGGEGAPSVLEARPPPRQGGLRVLFEVVESHRQIRGDPVQERRQGWRVSLEGPEAGPARGERRSLELLWVV
ncbi:MAG: hypothetical protein EA397_12130 [Deltaproteobacteria bacterium]|nr:MAG: hypothetical protein EA397_12130 [Deltaproteobacteria bacterium]